MISRLPSPPQPLFQSHSRIIQPALVEKVHPAVRPRRPEQSGHRVDNKSNLVFRLLGHRDVHHRSNKLDAAGLIVEDVSYDVDIFDGAIRHHQAIFMLKILPALRRPLNGLFHQGGVFRVHTLEHEFHRRGGRSIVMKDSIGFLRPDDFAGRNFPAKASGVTEPLRFRQVCLASLQLRFLEFQGLGDESPIHRGRQQSQPEDEQGGRDNSSGAECGDAYGTRQVHWHAGGRKMGGGHASVMHDGNRRAHYNGARYLSPAGRRFFISQVKGNP